MDWFAALAALLPTITWAGVFWILRARIPSADVRLVLVIASAGIGVLVVIITEGLSLAHSLAAPYAVGTWSIAAIAVALTAARGPRRSVASLAGPFGRLSFDSRLMITLTVAIAAVTGIVAAAATPNNWDSMTYHLSRSMRWAQDRSVDFYPTNIERQLHPPPFAEYALLQSFLLTGDDGFFNLLQWSSMVGSVVGVSVIARQLGAASRGQVLSALYCAALPMGIVQSSSTQNGYVVAFWLVAFLVLLLAFKDRPTIMGGALAGAALGLALLTKGTAYIFAAPFGLLALMPVWPWRLATARCVVWAGFAGLGVVLLLNAGHYSRNLDLYGSILGPGGEEGSGTAARYANDVFSVPVTASNLARNLTLHLSTPWRPVNERVLNASLALHGWLGVSPSDPRTTWMGQTYTVPLASTHEDYANNPVHLLLLVGTLLALPFVRFARTQPSALFYAVALVGGFVLFAALLRWQPWHSRLHLAWFVLSAPLVGCVLGRAHAAVLILVSLTLAVCAWPYLMMSESRPLLGKASVLTNSWTDEMFLVRRAEVKIGTLRSAAAVESMGCRQVGLLLGGNDWEYPFWRLLRADGGERRLEHVAVQNASIRYQRPDSNAFEPCAVIAFQKPTDPLRVGSRDYELAATFAAATLYLPRGQTLPPAGG